MHKSWNSNARMVRFRYFQQLWWWSSVDSTLHILINTIFYIIRRNQGNGHHNYYFKIKTKNKSNLQIVAKKNGILFAQEKYHHQSMYIIHHYVKIKTRGCCWVVQKMYQKNTYTHIIGARIMNKWIVAESKLLTESELWSSVIY